MDASGLRRKDTTKGPPLRILSLDGGGVRGYSTLIILQELMHRTFVKIHGRAPKRSEIPKPCDHFDLIIGTGTGGLIALMLGRLRMNIETCKDTYVRLTKRVFETDKTIAGIPYRSTLFKASKLEEAIRECVREHTVFGDEGNDDEGDDPPYDPKSPHSPVAPTSGVPHRTLSSSSRYSQIGVTPITDFRGPYAAARWGKPNALLYDARENRTKTAVTAVYKGTPRDGGSSVLLRSYDSRKETALEERCTIWQAGRATCATALAFKPIQIGQSVFLDEGAGKYNPGPQALVEAYNEWPGREIGVFISIGTGKRPAGTNNQQHLWWEGFVSGGMGDFAEARRRLITKIEGCEETHQRMISKYLLDHNVDLANYYRLNVEVGVGDFGMNEWNGLGEISTNTRRYLAGDDVQAMTVECAVKLSRIHRANIRYYRTGGDQYNPQRMSWEVDHPLPDLAAPPLDAVELPAEDVLAPPTGPTPTSHPHQQSLLSPHNYRRPSDDDKFVIMADEPFVHDQQPRRSGDQLVSPYRRSNEGNRSSQSLPIRRSNEHSRPTTGGSATTPPPLPPKTPIQGGPPIPATSATMNRPPAGISAQAKTSNQLPYPVEDGPPPVNTANKPQFGVR